MASPSLPLFRPEALRARQDTALGTIRLAAPPHAGTVTVVALVIAAALVGYAVEGEVTRRARVVGVLAPVLGSLPLVAGAAGVLLERRVAEGQAVEAGEVLFVIGTDRIGDEGAAGALVAAHIAHRRATLLEERRLRLRQAAQRREALRERQQALEAEHRQALREVALAERRAALAERTAQGHAQLAEQGYLPRLQGQARQEELLELQARAEAARRAALALQRERLGLQRDLQALDAQRDTELAQLDRQLATLAQESRENEARRRQLVVAPRDGTVSALALDAGAAVAAGQTLATLVPPSALEARLYAPSRSAGFVQPGQPVWLRYAAYPPARFGLARGTVATVALAPLAPNDLPSGSQQALLQAARSAEPLYRISVALAAQHVLTEGRLLPLKPGMALEADLVQDRRAVWEWLFEPLLAARANAGSS